jgi:HD-GYP domain-containing protein (c-di-GMP phosphodiesterase class II)
LAYRSIGGKNVLSHKSPKNTKNASIGFDIDDGGLVSLLHVGKALTSEHNINKVLELILAKAMENANADGGSIYLVERIPQDCMGGARPRFHHMLKFHHSVFRAEQSYPGVNRYIEMDSKSVAGYVALSGQSARIRDCYLIPKNAPYAFNPKFDAASDYRTKSILAVPIKTNKGQVIGVVQLVNKLKPFRRRSDSKQRLVEKEIIAFSENDTQLVQAFAAHAAVALENAKLTDDISKLFESFVRASVSAIESRDPATSGHSDRVALLTLALAETVGKQKSGLFADIDFDAQQMREIRYAALLHDFGKIGVQELLLLKAKKLFPHELETIILRIETLKAKHEANQWRQTAIEAGEAKDNGLKNDSQQAFGQATWNIDKFNNQVEKIKQKILTANEPKVLEDDFDIAGLMSLIDELSKTLGQPILTEDEKRRLQVPRGSLSEEERKEIERHVSKSFDFLKQIAWTEDLQDVPDIAHAHHEKLNGKGYPRSLTAEQIPIQSRMMAIADIYDALTSMDRPYKKSVSPERAIEILKMEAEQNHLDIELVNLFVEEKVYLVTADDEIEMKDSKKGRSVA